MGKKTEDFKKARISSIATISAELIENKKNVQKLADFQKTLLDEFTRKTQQTLAEFTANTQTMLTRYDEVSKAIDAKVKILEEEMELIRSEQLTEKHFEGEYNTLKEQVEGMYASVRMFQKPVEESNKEKSTIGDTSTETGETEAKTVASPSKNADNISEVDEKTNVTEPEKTNVTEPEKTNVTEPEKTTITEPEKTIITEPESEQILNDTMKVAETEDRKNIDNAVDDEEFDRMYEDILDTTEKSIDTDTQSMNNTTIQVVESTVTTEEQEAVPNKPDAPASIAELLNRASKINI